MSADAAGRTFEHLVTVDAPVDVVWKALSDGDELRRWFPIDARVTPPGLDSQGGAVFLSWGPACEGEAPITIWEPLKHLQWKEKHDGGAVLIAVDFFVEGRGGQTVVRLVQSGFGKGGKWDDYLDSISNGWKFELESLKHYLARHRGKDRGCAWLPTPCELPMEQAWEKIAASGAVVKEGSLEGHTPGAPYRFVGPDGRTFSGTVLRNVKGKTFAGTVRELDDAIIRIEIERTGETSMPCVWVAIWGEKKDQAAEVAESWRAAVAGAVGAMSDPSSPRACQQTS